MKFFPVVSIQLPIYNEKALVNGLLHAITTLDYPREKMQIQILDDSTDSTTAALKKLARSYQQQGFWIEYTHRTERKGFKAGNLANGLMKAKGEFIIVFDADFEPETQFIKKTLPFFVDKRVGFVQTRWKNRNYHDNLITYLGGIAYDAHLFIEQNARSQAGLFMGFSGSGGVWRKECLLSIGGWKWDTLTEDIDISFRAQLEGWKGRYISDALSSAELPNDMNSYKLQQYRWAKGSAQCFRKYFNKVIQTKIPLMVKIMAVLHLLSYVTIPCMPILLLLVLPICLYGGGFISLFWWMALGGIGPTVTFGISQLEQKDRLIERLVHIPFVLLMAAGISLDALSGVFSGLLMKGGEFIRTPRVAEGKQTAEINRKSNFLNYLVIAEILMSTYLFATVQILWASTGKYLAPWLLSSSVGFLLIAGSSIVQLLHCPMKTIRQEN